MSRRDLFDLVLLAALWGASFLFMRVAAPAFGPFALVDVRVGIAAVVLLAWLAWRRGRAGLADLRAQARPTMTIGVLNSALPFVLLSYATLTLTAGLASILNATTPMWTAVVAAVWLRDRITRAQAIGLALGLCGVVVLLWGKVSFAPSSSGFDVTLAVLACLAATLAYGVSANAAKKFAAQIDPLVTATGSQVGAALLLLPLAVVTWPAPMPSTTAWLAALALGVACTALAYLLYFRLMVRVGPLRAASVTFLIPLFATLWGALVLHEALTLQMAAGGAVILAGTWLALRRAPAPKADGMASRQDTKDAEEDRELR
jgi:drug/metabolite transporter (DMT)-like permease